MNTLNNTDSSKQSRVEIYQVSFLAPFMWLTRGWRDLMQHAKASLTYGLMVALMGMVIFLFASNHIYLIAVAISGFLLAGPFLSIGLCELSRQQDKGLSLGFDDSLAVFNDNRAPLVNFAIVLLVISTSWFVLSGSVLSVLFGNIAPNMADSVWADFLEMVSFEQVLLYLVVGGILASIVFALSIVTIPAIIDAQLSAEEAMSLSAQVLMKNFPAMIVWAGLIVFLTFIAFISYFVAMVIIFPLLGHATWYAYRDLIDIEV